MKFIATVKLLFQRQKFLVMLCLVSFVMVLIGINYGLPLHLIGDEESLIGGTLSMALHHSFIPSLHPEYFDLLYYPVLLPYSILAASLPFVAWQLALHGGSLAMTQNYLMWHLSGLWISARLISAVCFCGLIAVTYALAALLYNKRTAVFASLLVASSFFGVNLSHWMRHWSATTLSVYVTLYVILRYMQRRDVPAWLPGVVGVIGMGIAYVVAFGYAVGACIVIVQRKLLGKDFVQFIVRNVLIFVIGTAAIVSLYYQDFIHQFYSEDGTITAVKSFADGVVSMNLSFLSLILHEPILVLLFVFGLVLAKAYRKRALFILGTCFLYMFCLYLFYHTAPRYMYFCVPALALVGGSGCDWLIEHFSHRGKMFVYACLCIAFAIVIRFDWLLLHTDTRLLALHWMRTHASESMVISSPNINAARTHESLLREQDIATINAVERSLLAHPDEAGSTVLMDYTNLHFWKSESLDDLNDYLEKVHPRYAILQYWEAGDFGNQEHSLRAGSTMVARFTQSSSETALDIAGDFYAPNWVFFTMQRLGPTVEIYELQYPSK